MLLNISNIQHFSVGDGDGIRTTVFFKGCNLRCPWCHNPENISPQPTEMYYKNIGKTKVCGMMYTASRVLEEILKDKDYYEESGGGVTFSGGEVMLQADAAGNLAELIKAENISLTVDTAGNVCYSEFRKMNPFTDEYLYDFKTASEEKYSKIIGGDLKLVTDNLIHLLEDDKKVRIRIPLIPGFNTDDNSVSEICTALSEIGIKAVDLLPFHRMGSGKYEAMGLQYHYKDTQPLDKVLLEKIKQQYLQYFDVTVEK